MPSSAAACKGEGLESFAGEVEVGTEKERSPESWKPCIPAWTSSQSDRYLFRREMPQKEEMLFGMRESLPTWPSEKMRGGVCPVWGRHGAVLYWLFSGIWKHPEVAGFAICWNTASPPWECRSSCSERGHRYHEVVPSSCFPLLTGREF